MRDALLIQMAYSGSGYAELIALAYPRHVGYALRHGFDYLVYVGSTLQREEPPRGAWEKVFLVQQALERGYDFVVYLDADTLIANMAVDLREALRDKPFSIGACWHPGRGGHLNSGVLFFRRTRDAVHFIRHWLGERGREEDKWQEQAVLNRMAHEEKFKAVVGIISDVYNATRRAGTYTDEAIIIGYHSPETVAERLARMKADMDRLDQAPNLVGEQEQKQSE